MRDIVFDKMLCHAFVFGKRKNYLHFFLQSSIIVKMSLNDLFYYIASFIAVVAVLTMHEFAHAFAAYKCGDPTPKWNRRLTLNPLCHFDVTGLICFTLVGFGWAKPVPINPNNFNHYRRGLAITASAGVIVNYIFAFLWYPIFCVILYYALPNVDSQYGASFLYFLFYLPFAYSLSFCVFNLLPLNPLDGFRIVEACSKRRGKVYRFLYKYGHWILLFLIVESFICRIFTEYLGAGVIGTQGVTVMGYLDILGWFMTFATKIFGHPITALWGLIPW